jgi:uncharacterized protein (TIGR00369 family)
MMTERILPKFQPQSVDFAQRVRLSFQSQPMMNLIDARLVRVEAGEVDVEIPFSPKLTQHNGFLHGGTVATLADTACGYAAYSLTPDHSNVLTVEFKINFLSPAIGDRFVTQGRVLRLGKSIIVAQADVMAYQADQKKHVATMIATLMCI